MTQKILYYVTNNICERKSKIMFELYATYARRMLDAIIGFIPTIILAIVIYIAGVFLNRLILDLFAKGVEKSKMDQTVKKFLSSVIKIVITALVLIIVLTVLGIPMTSIITVLGTAGVAVGLALKDSLANVAGGVLLLINQTIKVGNYIEVGGNAGIVEEVSILYTKIVTLDNKDIFIPNGIVATSPVINYSSEDDRRVDLVFAIAYDADHKKAMQAVTDVAKKHSLILQDKEIFVRIGELSTSSVNLTVRVWTKNANYWDVYFDMIQQVKEKFDAEGIRIPYNQLDVHMIETK